MHLYRPRERAPSEIKRLEQRRVIYVFADLFNRSQAEVEGILTEYFESLELPEDYTIKLGGEAEERRESFKSLMFAMLMAILLVYMIMAAQFESLWQPFIIMFSVPLSMIGISTSLFITGTPVSVVAMLGVIMLAGMVVNNAIVLIEYINDLRAEGASIADAVERAAQIRFRPIIMTTLTTLLGLLPLALGIGEGSELRAPMAIVVMGGLLLSTALTLLVIPALYLITETWFEKPAKEESSIGKLL